MVGLELHNFKFIQNQTSKNQMDETSKHTKNISPVGCWKKPAVWNYEKYVGTIRTGCEKKNDAPYNFLTWMSQEDSKWLVSGL